MKRWNKYCAFLLAFFVGVQTELHTFAASEELELYARSAVLMDGDSGRILYGKEEDVPMPMASTTKIMTCILALENGDQGMICTVSEKAAAQPKVKLGMKTGDSFYLKDLLYSLMLESHNDTAVCIAENIGGTVEGFAEMMNEKAREIGCSETYYITPNGLDAEDEKGVHHTTASDLALVMRYCLKQSPKKEEFLEITGTSEYSFTNIEGDSTYGCSNHNALLTILNGALSGKTGFTNDAGYCYVGAVRQDEKLLIVSLLACGWPNNRGYKWVDTKKLVRYGAENFEPREIIDRNLTTDAIAVEAGVKTEVATRIQWGKEGDSAELTRDDDTEKEKWKGDTAQMTVLMRPDEEVQIQVETVDNLIAPVKNGQKVGRIHFLVEGEEYISFPIVTAGATESRNYVYCLRNLIHQFVNFVTKKLAIFG